MSRDISIIIFKEIEIEIPKDILYLKKDGFIGIAININGFEIGNFIEEIIKTDNLNIIDFYNKYYFIKLCLDLKLKIFKLVHDSNSFADIPDNFHEFTVSEGKVIKESIISSEIKFDENHYENFENNYRDTLEGIDIGRYFENFDNYKQFEKQYIKEKTVSYVMVDIESDGPIPGDYSMISFGAVIVDEKLDKTFFRQLKPISPKCDEEALKVSGYTRLETFNFGSPLKAMQDFHYWIDANCKGRPIFISDNNGFDFMFIAWYFHHFLKFNPFGHSSQNLGSLYKGLVSDTFKNFKHLRETSHTHNPVDDAMGNAEALLKMKKELGLNINLE